VAVENIQKTDAEYLKIRVVKGPRQPVVTATLGLNPSLDGNDLGAD
jgi:hypothetical protein